MSFNDISFGSEDNDTSPVGEPASPEPTDEDSLADGFLKEIPDGDRSIVAKYVKNWDGQVTNKFKAIREQYKPYKELGDINTAKQLRELQVRLQSDPVGTFKLMRDALIETYGPDFDKDGEPAMPGFADEIDDTDDGGQSFDPQQTGINDPNEQRLLELQNELEEMRSWRDQQESSAREAAENKQLDGILQQMHTDYGAFDDSWILLQFANGATPEQAIQAWQQFTESIVGSSRTRPAPRIMGGQGGVPSNQVDVTKLAGRERRDVVKAFLDLNNAQ